MTEVVLRLILLDCNWMSSFTHFLLWYLFSLAVWGSSPHTWQGYVSVAGLYLPLQDDPIMKLILVDE